MIETWQKELIDRYLAAYNAFDIEAMLAQLDPGPDGPKAGTQLEMNGRSEFAFGAGGIVRIVDRS
jgi:hypothetical protein